MVLSVLRHAVDAAECGKRAGIWVAYDVLDVKRQNPLPHDQRYMHGSSRISGITARFNNANDNNNYYVGTHAGRRAGRLCQWL